MPTDLEKMDKLQRRNRADGSDVMSSTAVWLLPETMERVNRTALMLGCSRSELVRSAIRYASLRKLK